MGANASMNRGMERPGEWGVVGGGYMKRVSEWMGELGWEERVKEWVNKNTGEWMNEFFVYEWMDVQRGDTKHLCIFHFWGGMFLVQIWWRIQIRPQNSPMTNNRSVGQWRGTACWTLKLYHWLTLLLFSPRWILRTGLDSGQTNEKSKGEILGQNLE